MKYGFYFRFYKKLHNDFICCILSNLAYFFICIKYLLKKVLSKSVKSSISDAEALKIVNNVYGKLDSKPEYINPDIDDNIDLSVVIPIYNYVEIIEENILSILNQSTKYRYEIILVDDGSTDGASKVCDKFASEYSNIVVIHKKNSGIGAARNTGINNSRGKYLMFIDCDDIVHDDIIEVLMNKAYSNDYDMVMCGHNLSKEKDGVIIDKIPNIYSKYNLMGYKNGDKIMNLAGLPWCKVYKRHLWNNVRFFPNYWYEDTIIQFLIFTQCHNYSYIPKLEYEYKWYEKNFSHVQNNAANIKSIDSYWLLIEILDQYKELGLPKDDKLYTLVLRHISSYYFSSIKGLNDELIEALFVLAKKLYLKYKPNHKVRLPYMLRQVENAFDSNDIELWKLSSCYQ